MNKYFEISADAQGVHGYVEMESVLRCIGDIQSQYFRGVYDDKTPLYGVIQKGIQAGDAVYLLKDSSRLSMALDKVTFTAISETKFKSKTEKAKNISPKMQALVRGHNAIKDNLPTVKKLSSPIIHQATSPGRRRAVADKIIKIT